MSQDPKSQDENVGLQHAAEHAKPGKRNPVLLYLVILFAAAFLLLLMSYFMQQRTNRETINGLQQTSSSAKESLENLITERDQLKEQTTALEAQNAQLQQELDSAKDAVQAAQYKLDQIARQTEALQQLNQIRALYNQRRNDDARDLLQQWETEAPGVLEQELTAISRAMNAAAREVYDPLDAYHKLVDWLDFSPVPSPAPSPVEP